MSTIKRRSCTNIVSKFILKVILSKFALQKLPIQLQNLLTVLAGNEISCDCRFKNDDGSFLYSDRNDANQYALIATSGQDDEWLLQLSDNIISFLDHCNWEDENAIINLRISLEHFIVMADLLKQYESIQYPQESDLNFLNSPFMSLSDLLLERFPFAFN